MGKELTPMQMREILIRRANELGEGDINKRINLIAIADCIIGDLLGGNRGHVKFFLQNPQELVEMENRYRELFFKLTKIDSRNADLPPENGGFEAE